MNRWVWLAPALILGLPLQAVATPWDIQFAEPYAFDRKVQVMDLDVEAVPPGTFEGLIKEGVQVLCYVSVGTAEIYRPDWDQFPQSVIGKQWPDWPDEYFLDIRQQEILLPIMAARFQACKDAGATGIDPDNQDQQWADGGFEITEADAVAYMRALARLAHDMGLTIGQKNNPDTVAALLPTLDFMVTEDCFQDGWCARTTPYIAAGKPVYAIEYTDRLKDWQAACAEAQRLGLSMILKDRNLNGQGYKAC